MVIVATFASLSSQLPFPAPFPLLPTSGARHWAEIRISDRRAASSMMEARYGKRSMVKEQSKGFLFS